MRTVPPHEARRYGCRRSGRNPLGAGSPSDLGSSRLFAATEPARRPPELRLATGGSTARYRRTANPGTERSHQGPDDHDEQPRQQGLVGTDVERLVGVEWVAAGERGKGVPGEVREQERQAGAPTRPSIRPSSMNGTRMNQLVAPTSFMTATSRRRAKMASWMVLTTRAMAPSITPPATIKATCAG